eukprot:790192-Prorocentrum_minimum.AAC.2
MKRRKPKEKCMHVRQGGPNKQRLPRHEKLDATNLIRHSLESNRQQNIEGKKTPSGFQPPTTAHQERLLPSPTIGLTGQPD